MNHFKIFQKIALLALILVGVSVSKAQAQSGCESDNTVTITVLVDPTFSLTPPALTTICSGGGGTITAAIPSGYGAVCTNFSWYSSPDGGTTWSAAISGETAATLTVTGLTATTTYKAQWNCALACGSPESSNTVTMTVNPDITESGTIAGLTQCTDASVAGGSLSVTVAGGAGNYIYEWFESPDGTSKPTTGAVLQTTTTASTSNSYTPARVLAGTRYYFVRVTSVLASGAGCDALLSSIATVQNVAPLTAGAATLTLAECTGGTGTISAPTVSGGTGSYTYAWTVDNGSGFGALTAADGTLSAGNTVLTPTSGSTVAATRTYRLSITDASGSSCNTVGPIDYTVTVSAPPALTVNTPPQTICVGGTVTLQATRTGGTGTCSITWEDNTGTGWNAVTTGTVTAPTATTSQLVTAPITSAGAPQYRARVVCTGSGCCN